VVCRFSADDDLTRRLSLQAPVLSHHANCRIVCFGTRVCVEDVVEPFGREPHELLGKRDCRLVRTPEETARVTQFPDLAGRRLAEFAPSIAQRNAGETRKSVQESIPIGVPHVRARSAFENQCLAGRERQVIRERMKIVRDIDALPVAG
jgi:hypothetical protein